jgi:hypothetical protein
VCHQNDCDGALLGGDQTCGESSFAYSFATNTLSGLPVVTEIVFILVSSCLGSLIGTCVWVILHKRACVGTQVLIVPLNKTWSDDLLIVS